nr:hypothetical protein [Deltaproteobacteria bacterium]
MPLRVVLAVLGALIALFGASALTERVAHAATHAEPALVHEAGSPFLAGAAAPLCDERGASVYAAEPAPQPIEGGAVAATTEAPCKMIATAAPASSSRDDLQRTPEVPHDSTVLLPAPLPAVVGAVMTDVATTLAIESPGDDHAKTDNPPPKPSPWRS